MKKIVLWIIGIITLALGFIGIFIPVFPTTPFLLVALACFVNSSSKMHRFILENKYLGPYVKDYTSGNGIPMRAKWRAVSLIWITIGFSAISFYGFRENYFVGIPLLLLFMYFIYHNEKELLTNILKRKPN